MTVGQILEIKDCTHRQEQETNGRNTQSGAKADPGHRESSQEGHGSPPQEAETTPWNRPRVLSASH